MQPGYYRMPNKSAQVTVQQNATANKTTAPPKSGPAGKNTDSALGLTQVQDPSTSFSWSININETSTRDETSSGNQNLVWFVAAPLTVLAIGLISFTAYLIINKKSSVPPEQQVKMKPRLDPE